MINSKLEVTTRLTLELDEEDSNQLKNWLKWAFVAWQQCQYHPQLIDEIFHGAEGTERAPDIKSLSHDRVLVMLNAIERPKEKVLK